MKETVIRELEESASIKQTLAENLVDNIADAARIIIHAYRAGKKLLLIGNGGSAADAQHIATEFVGRLTMERKAMPAIALTTDTSLMTALTNDYGFDTIFRRQVEALSEPGDVLLAITTSGTSPNVIEGVKTARDLGVTVIGLTGRNGGVLKDMADLSIIVPSDNTQRIQEAHITIGHIICYLAEKELFGKTGGDS